MPKKSAHPHVAWREGRPRFSPGPELRAAGHKARNLQHDDGRWFSRGEAVDWSDAFVKALNAEKAATAARASRAPAGASRASGGSVRSQQQRTTLYTVERLFEEWFRSPKFQLPAEPHELARQRQAKLVYSPKSVRDYKQKARVIASQDPSLWAAPVDALSQEVMLGFYEALVAGRGLATAHGTLLVFSSALSWGRRRGKFTYRSNAGQNPAQDLGMIAAPARCRFGSRVEISTLIAAADHLGWHEMGDMIVLGVWTGQRQEDRLLMVEKGQLNGRRIFRQLKTGALVSVREAPELDQRMRASAERRRIAGVVNPRIILDEQQEAVSGANGERKKTFQPFPDDGDRYRKRFNVLRSIAGAGILDVAATDRQAREWRAAGRNMPAQPVWHVPPCPSLLGDPENGVLPFQESDLRATSVTWQGIAGATIPEIIAVTGHTPGSATNILKHYLAAHPDMADSAIGKMVTWWEGGSEALTGV